MQSKSNQVRPISQSSGVAREEAKGGQAPLKLYCVYIFAVHIFIGQLFNFHQNTNIIDIILVFAFGDFFHCLLLLYEQQTVFETAQIYKIFPGSAPRSIPAYTTAFAVRFKVSIPLLQIGIATPSSILYIIAQHCPLFPTAPALLSQWSSTLFLFRSAAFTQRYMLMKKNISRHI